MAGGESRGTGLFPESLKKAQHALSCFKTSEESGSSPALQSIPMNYTIKTMSHREMYCYQKA